MSNDDSVNGWSRKSARPCALAATSTSRPATMDRLARSLLAVAAALLVVNSGVSAQKSPILSSVANSIANNMGGTSSPRSNLRGGTFFSTLSPLQNTTGAFVPTGESKEQPAPAWHLLQQGIVQNRASVPLLVRSRCCCCWR